MQPTRAGASLRRELREACAEDCLFFLQVFCWLYEPRVTAPGYPKKIPFVTFTCQDRAVETLIQAIGQEDVVVEKSRDMGASYLVLAVLYWMYAFHGGNSFGLPSKS